MGRTRTYLEALEAHRKWKEQQARKKAREEEWARKRAERELLKQEKQKEREAKRQQAELQQKQKEEEQERIKRERYEWDKQRDISDIKWMEKKYSDYYGLYSKYELQHIEELFPEETGRLSDRFFEIIEEAKKEYAEKIERKTS